MEQGLERLRNTSNRQQLKDYLMQTQLLQQYNVSISGGTERMSNYMSLMYEKMMKVLLNVDMRSS